MFFWPFATHGCVLQEQDQIRTVRIAENNAMCVLHRVLRSTQARFRIHSMRIMLNNKLRQQAKCKLRVADSFTRRARTIFLLIKAQVRERARVPRT